MGGAGVEASASKETKGMNQGSRHSHEHMLQRVTRKEHIMQNVKTTKFDGNKITVKELTVRQVRDCFAMISDQKEEYFFLDDLLNQPVPVVVIEASTGISIETLSRFEPSKLISLAKEVAVVNPSLASLIKRRLAALETMQQQKKSLQTPLTGPSAA